MMSQIPFELGKINPDDIDREILRAGIIAELDAVNLYEQLASMTDNQDLKKVFADIAKEEKTHVGEFQALLLKLDKEQVDELEGGRKEVEELTK
ncbi:MAG: ferritin family protein [Patescibacteria group bacterium]